MSSAINHSIQVEGGLVSGVNGERSDVIIFKGIPYAAPPVGDLRWCPPKPVIPWEGVRKCDTFGKICPQPFQPEEGFYRKEFYDEPDPETSEDCLYLNIWLPKSQLQNQSELLPVSIYIHGGAFDHGWGHEKEFDGEAFNSHKTILVSINYRVNIFGFLSHPILLQNEETKFSSNLGILDILKAIKWVKKYVRNFGGDPNRLTLFGQSAGSTLTSILSVIQDSKGLFNNVIMQSGCPYKSEEFEFVPIEKALQNGTEFFEPFNVNTVQDMRKINAKDLIDRIRDLLKIKNTFLFFPTIDNNILLKKFTKLTDEDNFHPQNVIIGYNSNDLFVESMKNSVTQFANVLSSNKNKNVFVYYFSPDIPGDDKPGAFHSCELWYVFGTLKRCWRSFDQKDFGLSDKMVSYWCNFFKTGDPNQQGLPDWPLFNKNNHKMIEFNYEISYVDST